MLKFFDCNCMIGKLSGVRLPYNTAGELFKALKYYNITKALVFHSPYGPGVDNEQLLAAVAGKRHLYPVVWAAPWETSKERFTARTREILEQNACGLRLFPASDDYDFSDEQLKGIMKIVARRRLPVLIDADQLGGFGALAQMLARYPKVPFILTKIGVGRLRYIYDLLDKHSNFYVDTSLLRSFQGLEDMVDKFGADRVLFGSYLPLLDPGAAVTRVLYSGLSQADKQKVAFGNLEEIVSRIRR